MFPKNIEICKGNLSQSLILIFIQESGIKSILNTSRNDNKISQIQIKAILMANQANWYNKKVSN